MPFAAEAFRRHYKLEPAGPEALRLGAEAAQGRLVKLHRADVSTGTLAKATGLSRTYCQDVRKGKFVPHPRHWDGFKRAYGLEEGQVLHA
jgi:hypothetical protein